MAKITRAVAKIFGSSAGANEIEEFGSFANGTAIYSTDVTLIQSLANWLGGWFDAVIGENAPTIEDMNAVCYVLSYQIAYLMQAGIAEWDATTTYYIGSFASDGAGNFYVSLTNTNLNNALTNTTNWRNVVADPSVIITSAAGNTILTNTSHTNQTVIGSTTQTITLPDASTLTLGTRFVITNFSTGTVTVNLNDGTFRTEVVQNSVATLTFTA